MQENAVILSNTEIAKDIWRMEIKTNLAKEARPGQFIEISVPGFYLRRPISICEIKNESLIIIYKVLGQGTEKMTELTSNDLLDIFGPLGNGFPIEDQDKVLLVGGGVGVPPLYETAKQYRLKGSKVDVVLGFNDEKSIFYTTVIFSIKKNLNSLDAMLKLRQWMEVLVQKVQFLMRSMQKISIRISSVPVDH